MVAMKSCAERFTHLVLALGVRVLFPPRPCSIRLQPGDNGKGSDRATLLASFNQGLFRGAMGSGSPLDARNSTSTAPGSGIGRTLCLLCASPEERYHQHQAEAFSTARAARKTVASSKCLPRICAPMGRPCDDSPQGTDIPQIPARLAVTV
jgi:hypothetical protein